MINIKNIIFLFFCFFIPFEDTQLSSFGGVLTASPSIIFLVLGSMCCFFTLKLVSIRLLLLMLLVNIISLGYFFYWIHIFPTIDVNFIFERGIRFFIIIAIYFCAIYYSLNQPKELIICGGKIISFVIILSLLCQFLFPSLIYGTNFLHSSEYISIDRMRGFAFEASSFGYQIICAVFILSIIYRVNLLFTIFIACLLSIISTSKGAIFILLLSVLAVFLIIKNVHFIYKLILIILGLILTYFIVNEFLLSSFMSDIENYTSVATRLTVFLLGIKTLIYYPMGVGYFGFLPLFYAHGNEIIMLINKNSPVPLIFTEVESYFQLGTFKSVGTKSTILDLIIFFGWLFVIPFFIFCKKIFINLRRENNYKVMILSIFVLLSNLFYISSLTLYLTPFLIGFILCISRKKESI